MSYFVGANLTRKIQEYDLAQLDKLLADVAAGDSSWPHGYSISATENILESTRVVLYSILHKYGLKNEFTVKMIPSRSVVTIDLKTRSIEKRRGGGIQALYPENKFGTNNLPLTTQEEDITGLFSEQDPLLSSDKDNS